uniref:LysM domain-containing protein n=1 Tax=Ananas comosus var. bracteatus TaxID=296719 RepID=A0A6V7PZT8_ANACO|nr:unnamed protein product [Ananas comosus var. bracteatus]
MMQREKGGRNGSYEPQSNGLFDGFVDRRGGLFDGFVDRRGEIDSIATIPVSSSSSLPSSPPSSSSSCGGYIEHRVSKMDTLAGVAIKYGVEVADIRRLNSLMTDLQMFARKSLKIPLPGKHPPSPFASEDSANGRELTPPRRPRSDILYSLETLKLKPPPCKISPAMSRLQGYYGLTPPKRGPLFDGTKMAVYKTDKSLYMKDEQLLPQHSPNSEPLPNRHKKSKSMVNELYFENSEIIGERRIDEAAESDNEKSIRRRQKGDSEPLGFSRKAGKGLALRPKSGSRPDIDLSQQNLVSLVDPSLIDGLLTVRKSSSTSNLQDSDSSSSIWSSSKWSLKPDTFAWPIFDGLPKPAKPATARRNKAALD